MAYNEVGPHTAAAGQRYRSGDFVIWAEDGMVFVEDQKEGGLTAMTCAEAQGKLVTYNGEMNIWDKKRVNADPTQRAFAITYYHILRGMVESIRDSIRDAKNQGDPNDEKVRLSKLRAFLRVKSAGSGVSTTERALETIFGPRDPNPIVFDGDTPWLARKPAKLPKPGES